MGLDVTAYSGIKQLDVVFNADGEPIDPITRKPIRFNYFKVYVNPDFPERAEGLKENGVYVFEKELRLRAGSYGGYNSWRETLARIAGYPAAPEEQYGTIENRHDAGAREAGSGPFFELIWFSDCEGFIGTSVSAKLAKDFADFQAKVDAGPDDYFKSKYGEWRKAFELAAQNGAVQFH